MKTTTRWFAIGFVCSMALGTVCARAALEVSASVGIHAAADFRAPLAPSGTWISVGTYGQCWRPASVSVEWRPYCNGHWVWTDCGWYWESDEPWSWACYHYGYWVYDPTYFWIWVPGIEWAPAWVSWRVGGGYIGWAPYAPSGISVAVTGPQYVFVQSGHFTEPVRPSTVVINNTTIINQTRVVNNMRQETRTVAGSAPQKVFVNEGPGVDAVQKATGKRLEARPVRELVRSAPVPSQPQTPAAESKNRPPAAASTEKHGAPKSRDARPQDSQVHGLPAPHQERPAPEKPKEQMRPAPTPHQERPAPEKPKEHLAPPGTARPGKPPTPDKPPKEPKEDKPHGSEGDHPKGSEHESESLGKADQF